MCFGRSSLKGEKPSTGIDQRIQEDYPNARPARAESTKVSHVSNMPDQKPQTHQPPAGPPPGYSNFNSNNPYASASGPPPAAFSPQPTRQSQGGYTPPSGPPPQQQQSNYAPPSGPPPSQYHASPSTTQGQSSGGYAPPSGPPPSQYHAPSSTTQGQNSGGYAPPSGPPPSHQQDQKAQQEPYKEPFHDWQNAVPDTALLPPPPAMGEDRSWANNASESDAERGLSWTNAHPLQAPAQVPSNLLEAVEAGDLELMRPFQYIGDVRQLRPRSWTVKAKKGSPDSCLMSTLPVYSVMAHSPLNIGRTKTIYYEVAISPRNRSEVSVGIGFVAQPYPLFRLPGWDRAGLGVHGDDGHRYVNDMWGGKPFTQPFRPGEVVGIGMTLSKRQRSDAAPPAYGAPQLCPIDTEVFFTRNGVKEGGWNLHEEGDAEQDRPVTGLEGYHDLFVAVGTFEEAEFEIRFEERMWLYKPE